MIVFYFFTRGNVFLIENKHTQFLLFPYVNFDTAVHNIRHFN